MKPKRNETKASQLVHRTALPIPKKLILAKKKFFCDGQIGKILRNNGCQRHPKEKILKHILNQFIKHLKDNKAEKKQFVMNGGLQKLQELKKKVTDPLKEKIDEINGYYPEDIVRYYTPEYNAMLLNKLD